MTKDQYTKVVIIGWANMGAPVHIISLITGIELMEVENVIQSINN